MKNSISHAQKAELMRDAYNRSAEYYDIRYRYIQYLKYGITLYKMINSNDLPRITFNKPILDLGGGTGLFFEFLSDFLQFLKNKSVEDENVNLLMELSHYMISSRENIDPISIDIPPLVICDISHEMLCHSLRTRGLYGLIACDGAHLPFRNSVFHMITAFTVLQNMVHKDLAISEAFRVLKDNGLFIISNLEKSKDKRQIIESLGTYFEEILPIYFKDQLVEFQKIIVQSDKYSQFHDFEKVEDFFLMAKKVARH